MNYRRTVCVHVKCRIAHNSLGIFLASNRFTFVWNIYCVQNVLPSFTLLQLLTLLQIIVLNIKQTLGHHVIPLKYSGPTMITLTIEWLLHINKREQFMDVSLHRIWRVFCHTFIVIDAILVIIRVNIMLNKHEYISGKRQQRQCVRMIH